MKNNRENTKKTKEEKIEETIRCGSMTYPHGDDYFEHLRKLSLEEGMDCICKSINTSNKSFMDIAGEKLTILGFYVTENKTFYYIYDFLNSTHAGIKFTNVHKVAVEIEKNVKDELYNIIQDDENNVPHVDCKFLY